jgi:hypothetical protein
MANKLPGNKEKDELRRIKDESALFFNVKRSVEKCPLRIK